MAIDGKLNSFVIFELKNRVITVGRAKLAIIKMYDAHVFMVNFRVPDDCSRHISRLVQLGNFWQHLRASGKNLILN